MIQIRSIDAPFDAPGVAASALTAIARAEAMGLLPDDESIDRLDASAMRRVGRHIAASGIGQAIVIELEGERARRAAGLERILRNLTAALEESPLPEREWPKLRAILGLPLLASLVGVAEPSVRRYLAGDRATPDDVAARLHFLALVVGDLAGTYSEIGIRRWFERKRTQLGDRTPREILKRGFRPEDGAPLAVARLARSLGGAGAT
jgi:hypothetical protein